MQNMTTSAEREFLLSDEVMAELRISRRTLDRWVATKRLPVVRIEGSSIRRYRRQDVDALIPRAAS